jgi:hypothetical protein
MIIIIIKNDIEINNVGFNYIFFFDKQVIPKLEKPRYKIQQFLFITRYVMVVYIRCLLIHNLFNTLLYGGILIMK